MADNRSVPEVELDSVLHYARQFVQIYVDRVNDPNGPMPPVFPYGAFERLAIAVGHPDFPKTLTNVQ